jgi:hypothetical protein
LLFEKTHKKMSDPLEIVAPLDFPLLKKKYRIKKLWTKTGGVHETDRMGSA